MQNRVGIVQSIDEAHAVCVLVYRQAFDHGQRWRIDDGGEDGAVLAQQMPLQVALQLTQGSVRLRHAKTLFSCAAISRATSSSAINSLNSGILSSRSIMVGTSPNRLSAVAYKSHTG